MMNSDALHSTQQQRQKLQNDPESQMQQKQQRRRTFHHRRINKHLILLQILAILAICSMESENNALDPTRQRRRAQNGDDSNDNDPGRRTEVDFNMASVTSRAFITLNGVENRPPNDPEIAHLEASLFYILNSGLSKTKNRKVQINNVEIPLESYSINFNSNIDSSYVQDNDDGGGEEDSGEEEEDEKEEDGPNLVSGKLEAEDKDYEDNIGQMTYSIPDDRFGGEHRRTSGSVNSETTPNYELHIEAVITTKSTSYYTAFINELLKSTITQNSNALVAELKAGKDLELKQSVVLEYFNDLTAIGCSSVLYDLHPDIEDKALAQALPPKASPTPEVRERVASNPGMPDFSSESVGNSGSSGSRNNNTKLTHKEQSTEKEPNLFERYNTISACIFVVTLIILSFWNMVRLNRKQVERRRKKVELAKIAYQAPLSMTNGLMDVGIAGRDGIVLAGAAAHNYDISAMDEDRYVGTMDKATSPPSWHNKDRLTDLSEGRIV